MVNTTFRRVRARVQRDFFAGLLVLGPLFVTVWVGLALTRAVDGLLDILPRFLHPEVLLGVNLPGLGIVLAVVTILSVGAAMRYYTGRRVVELYERALGQVPVLSSVYAGLKQLVDTLLTEDARRFRQVVLIEYPRKDVWALAFVTGDGGFVDVEEVSGGDQLLNVFLPTTPNPTSGFYLLARSRDLVLVDMDIEAAFKLIMSAGVVYPHRVRRSTAPVLEEPTMDVVAGFEAGTDEVDRLRP